MNIANLLRRQISRSIFYIIRRAGSLADSMSLPAYLVGGMVRDLLIGVKPKKDIDITVEGDGMAFAKTLADDLEASYKGFENFGTARIFMKDGWRMDVASARAEQYPEPGMLPVVELAAINQDLYRRDFTVNAIAVRINKNGFGDLLDPFNGMADLKAGLLKVLHVKSFTDDPTRMLRFIRFQSRFGFKPEKMTLDLFYNGISRCIFDTVSGERLREEITLLMREQCSYKAIKQLQASGALSALAKDIVFTRGIESLLDNICANEGEIAGLGVDPAILKLAAFLSQSPDRAVMRFLGRLKFSNNWEKAVLHIRQAVKLSAKLSRKGLSPGKTYMMLKVFGSEAMLYLMIAPGNKGMARNVRNYVNGICAAKPGITGKDLKKMGIKEGPIYGKILEKLTAAKFDGKLKTKKDEIQYVKKHFM